MRPLFRLPIRRSITRELDEELRFHLEMRTEQLIAEGWAPDAARAEALRQFGDLDDAVAYCRRADAFREQKRMRTEYLAELRRDLASAVRGLRRAPGFSLVAILTLALGIGATTAIFSAVRGILLRPLPFPEPDRVMMVLSTYKGARFPYTSPANFADWQTRTRSFSHLVAYTDGRAVLTGNGKPEEIPTAMVGADFFATLGLGPVAGRIQFSPAEAAWQGPDVVILGESIWRARFGADPSLVGRTIILDGRPHQVIGIAPSAATFPAGTIAWLPYTYDPAQLASSRAAVYLSVIGRLAPGVSVAMADADIAGIAAVLAKEYPEANERLGATVTPLQRWIVGDLDRPLAILLAGVGFVFLIACGNVANLLVVRGISRRGELAVRMALGAGRGRLVRQLATESLVLALLGAAGGIALAVLGTRLFVALAPDSIPRLADVRIDPLVLAFGLAAGFVSGLGFGLFPARWAAAQDPADALRREGRGSGAGVGVRARRLLVVAEVALSVILLAGAGLLIRSFDRLLRVDPGFQAADVVAFGLHLPDTRYSTDERQVAFATELVDRIRRLPGVRSADVGTGLPLSSFQLNFSFTVSGRPVTPTAMPAAEVRVVGAGYFETIGIRVIRGRGFGAEDRPGSPRALIANQAAVRRFFPDEDPIGKHLKFGWGRAGGALEGDIVGVAADVRQWSLAQDAVPQFWVAFDQWPVAAMQVVIRTAPGNRGVVSGAERIVHELDPDLAVSGTRTLESVVADSIAQPRFYTVLLSAFALVAIALSTIGIYGVTAYLVGSRTREIGVRVALGASRRDLVRLVAAEGIGLAAIGLVIGAVGALGLSRLMTALLYGVPPSDPVTYAGVSIVLLAAAAGACWIPARRATRVSPMSAIRVE
jgi:predicted permease